MTDSRARRWAPLSGIVFVVLMLLGLVGVVIGPVADDAPAISDFYDDPGIRRFQMTGFFLVLAACLFFVWFATAVHERIAGGAGRRSQLATLSVGAGVAAAALWAVAAGLFTSISFTDHVSRGFEDDFDPDLYRLAHGMGYVTWLGATAFALLVVLSTSAASLRRALLPAWLAWTGLLLALVMPAFLVLPLAVGAPVIPFLVPVYVTPDYVDPSASEEIVTVLPFVAVVAWVLVVSVTLIARPERSREQQPGGEAAP